jgi:hypothetical protein
MIPMKNERGKYNLTTGVGLGEQVKKANKTLIPPTKHRSKSDEPS